MNDSKLLQDSTQNMTIHSQEIPVYKRLGFHTALGTEWFEFSPEKMKGYFYELGTIMARYRFLEGISFSSVLDMSSLNIEGLDDQPVFGSNLSAILDDKVKDDARADMLKLVCGRVLNQEEFKLLRHQVNELVEADLVAANVKWIPESNIYLKVRLDMMSPHSPKFP